MQESNQTSGADTAAGLTALASWIDEQLGDETADRQWIAESAAARVRDITLQMLGAAELGRRPPAAELAARLTVARAAAGDFNREAGAHVMSGGPAPDFPSWAQRLHDALVGVLTSLDDAQPPALASHQREALAQALADAIQYRDPTGSCPNCEAHPAALCEDHAADLDKTDSYRALARDLGIEVAS